MLSYLSGFYNVTSRLLEALDGFRDRTIQRLLSTPTIVWFVDRASANTLTRTRGFLSCCLAIFFASNAFFGGYDPDFGFSVRLTLEAVIMLNCLTDLLDGPWARLRRRRKHNDGNAGEHLDPKYDKWFTVPICAYYFLLLGLYSRIIVGTLIIGDFAATAIRKQAEKYHLSLPANSFGRFKMTFLCLAIIYLVGFYPHADEQLLLIIVTAALVCAVVSVSRHIVSLYYQLQVEQVERAIQKEDINTL